MALVGPVIPAMMLLLRRIAADLALVHIGGLLLAGLAMLVEGAAPADLQARLPPVWAGLSAPLSLLGTALAVWRLRREGVLLALGTAGFPPRAVLPLAALLAALIAAPVPALLQPDAPGTGTWVRAPGAWWKMDAPGTPAAGTPASASCTGCLQNACGQAWPDPGSPLPPACPRPGRLPIEEIPAALLAGAAGAAAGLYGGAPVTLIAACLLMLITGLCRGLALSHGADWPALPPLLLAAWCLLLLWRAPLFPQR